jgi:hypothetical protein
MISDTAMSKILKLANGRHADVRKLASYFVGQGVHKMNSPRTVRETLRDFMKDYLAAAERLSASIKDLACFQSILLTG